MNVTGAFPGEDHDHQCCVTSILQDAEQVCGDRRVRFTAQRRHVLEVIAQSHSAIGAYEIIDRLAGNGKRPAPISVYRALDFLIEQGLVHRLASLNAYVACPNPRIGHGAQFLICSRCGVIGEVSSQGVDRAITGAASLVGFQVCAPVVEVVGVCAHCSGGGGGG